MSDISQSVLNFVQNFEKTFQNDKMFIFEKFEYDDFTLEEQKYIFDNLKTKQKCQLYNTISVEARNKYCEYLGELEPGPEVDLKGNKIIHKDLFISKIRKQAVSDK